MPAIKHLVVLMMENRSFDHMLGYLKSSEYPIDGLIGTEANLDDAGFPVLVNQKARYSGDLRVDPGHSFDDVKLQLYGRINPDAGQEPNMSGFVLSYNSVSGSRAKSHRIMNCFSPAKLPILSTLAQQFAVCDRWFCSVPGPTFPNRVFAHACTSLGRLDMAPEFLSNYRTVYEILHNNQVSSTIYYHDQTLTLSFPFFLSHNQAQFFGNMDEFEQDCKRNRLPSYCFVEPRYSPQDVNGDYFPANDQHPDHDVAEGEKLIKQTYQALRSNLEVWESTLFMITYDQHGGIHDHVPPPVCVAPDNFQCPNPPFDFQRLGVRVPAVLISPYIPAGTISHIVYDHTSLAATAMKLFTGQWPSNVLGRRAEVASTFESLCTLERARSDVPDFGRARSARAQVRARPGAAHKPAKRTKPAGGNRNARV